MKKNRGIYALATGLLLLLGMTFYWSRSGDLTTFDQILLGILFSFLTVTLSYKIRKRKR